MSDLYRPRYDWGYRRPATPRWLAGAGGGATAYRYLRVIFHQTQGWATSYTEGPATGISRLEFREVEGGPALAGTLSASFTQFGAVANLADGSTATSWDSGDNRAFAGAAYGHHVTLDLGEGNETTCVEVLMAAINSSSTRRRAPLAFSVLGSVDGTTYELLWSENGIGTWAAGEVKTFTLSESKTTSQLIRVYEETGAALACAEMEWRRTPGGAKETGGTMCCHTVIDSASYEPERAADGSGSTFTTTGAGGGVPHSVGTFFVGPVVDFEELYWYPRSDGFREDPNDFEVQRSLDGGMTFETIKSFSGISGWANHTPKVFGLT